MNHPEDPLVEQRQRLWTLIGSIPAGQVATYGQLAELAGLPGYARFVGRVLKQLPEDSKLPWFRVLNASGKISFPVDSERYRTQRQRLEDEGIQFRGQRIALKTYRWTP